MVRTKRHGLRAAGRTAAFVAAALAAATIAVPAAADQPAVVTETFSFVDVNACTGEEHTVTATVTMRVHSHGERIVSHNQWEVLTSDGFSGGGPETLVVNGQIVNFPLMNMLTSDSGAKIRVHLVEVFDLTTDPPTPKVQRIEFTCIRGGD